MGHSPRRTKDHRGVGQESGSTGRGGRDELGYIESVWKHAECFAAVCSAADGGGGEVEEAGLNGRGLFFWAGDYN